MPQDLTPEQRTQLDSNIKSMLANGASQEDVMSYATDFNSKYNLQKKNSLNGGGSDVNAGLTNFMQATRGNQSNGVAGSSSSQKENDHSDSWDKMQAQMAKKAADAGLPNFDNGNDRLNDAINRSEKAGYGFNHFTNNNDPTGDRTVSIDIENLTKALQKRLANEKNPASKTAISKELNYWQSELKDGMTAAEWKKQTGEADPIPQPSNGTNGIGGFSTQQSDIQKPVGQISNEQVNAANQQLQSAKNNSTEQNISTDIGQKQSQATQEKKRSDVRSAAVNTANLYFKNNPALFENVKKNDISLKNIPTEEKDQYSLKSLKNTSAFDRKVGELMNAYDSGELTTYKTSTGEDRLGRTMGNWDNFTSGLKEAWNAKEEANKILSMSKDDFIKHANEKLKEDENYLPVKPNQSSVSYNLGNAVPMTAKGVVGAGVGSAMAMAAPETMGLSTTALPALTAWLATVPDMANQAKANSLVDYYHRYKQENPNATDDEAYQHAQHASDLAGSEALLTGTALNFIGESGLPANTGQGLWKATGQWLKNQPQSVLAAVGIASGSSALKDAAIQKEGFKITPQEILDNANKEGGSMATMQLAFNLGFGALGAPKYLKAQGLEVLSKANPETVQKLSEQAVQNGWISQEQIDKGLSDLSQYQTIRKTLPENLDEDKAAAITGLIQKNENLEAEKKTQNKVFHDDIDAEIDANENKAKQILSSSQPLKHETDNLTGERGQNIGGRPTIEETEAKNQTLPASENNEAGNSSNGRQPAAKEGEAEKGVGEVVQPQQENKVNLNDEKVTDNNQANETSQQNLESTRVQGDNLSITEKPIQPNSVVEGKPIENEAPATSQEQADIYSEYPPTSLNYSGTGKLETEFGISQREPTTVKHDIETIKEADNLIEKGWKPKDAIDRVESGEANFVSDAEYINLTRYGAELAHRLRSIKDIDSPEYDSTLKELNRVANTANAAGQSTGRALGIRSRFKTVPDGSYADFMLTEMAANNDVTLTKNQKITATNEWSKFQKDKEQFEKDKQTFDDAVAKFNAEKEVAKAKKAAPKSTTKTHEDYVKDRVSLVEKLKQQKAEQEKYLADRGIQKAGFGLTLTTDMVKTIKDIVASHVEETAHKLADAIDNVYEQLKEIFPDLEKRDIHNVIAGEYNEKKLTKTEARIRMEDLRIEAQSINKLEKLEKGEVPKNEKAKIKRNAEIEQLRKQIGEHGITKLSAVKQRNEAATERIKEVIKKGDFSPEVKRIPTLQNVEFQKQFPDLFKQVQKSNDELIKTKNDIALRRAKWMYEHKSDNEKTLEVIGKSLNIPRTLMTIGDFSAVFRQAAIATSAHPVIASKALKFMFEAAANEKTYNRWLDEVHHDPLWATAEKSKLPITDPASLHAREHEEAFYGAQYAEKIPGVGAVVKASERAYNGYLNFIRWEMFKMYANEFRAKGKTYENNPKLYEGISSFIGSSTGRGGMSKNLNAASPLLNTVLFASKLIASRLNMLGFSDIPNLAIKGAGYATRAATLGKYGKGWGVDFGFYSKLPKEIRVKAAADMVKFVGVGLATLFLAKSMGAEVETDPRSSDFGKIKSGNTRWDIWGGFQPYARLTTQILTGQSKSATSGKVYDLDGSKFGGRGISDQIGTFARGKASPIIGLGWDYLSQRTMDQQTLDRKFGNPFNNPQGQTNLTNELLKSLMPLLINDIIDGAKDHGASAILTVGVPSLFGIGVQTYSPQPTKSKTNKTQVRQTPKRQVIQHR